MALLEQATATLRKCDLTTSGIVDPLDLDFAPPHPPLAVNHAVQILKLVTSSTSSKTIADIQIQRSPL